MRFTETTLAIALLGLHIPIATGLPMEELPQSGAPNVMTRSVDCIEYGTPYSCDIFCYAQLCLNLPSLLKHDKNHDRQETRRRESGNKDRPFSDGGVVKYQTITRNNDRSLFWTDEYPPASSYQGGKGEGGGKAIIQGATQSDQSSQGAWLKRLWEGIGDNDQIQLDVHNWDPALSPYCEHRKNKDVSKCTGNNVSPFYRRSDVKGPNGKTVYDHMGV